MTPQKGKGEKEKDGSVRDFPLYCRLPMKKIEIVDLIAKKKISVELMLYQKRLKIG